MLSLSSLVKKSESRINIVVGSVVTTNLYWLGRGVVYQIHGEQMPNTVRQVGGGVMVSGGYAEFDIVHDCGKFTKRLPECILRGVQWKILDEVADAEEIQRLCANAEECAEKEKIEEENNAFLFSAEMERLKTATEYSQLEQGDCSSGKLAAKNIRKELKQFKGVKFSVRNRHYSSVDVNWTDGPTLEKVKTIINKYKDGCFNAMQDIYEYSASPFNTVFGSAQYPSAQRSYSDAMIGKAIEKIISAYDLKFEVVPTAEDFRTGKLWSEKREVFHHGLQSKIHETLAGME
ncbi:LPD29 domain-containing protein [Rahnella sikkimica]|uniref:Large polyvalent protein associated domain-containing protein n=1 Tax=Rahnella sikkimica TaxID=1805933 RepID=A0A2L1UYZ6_9GAMM|nr:LPD29 domain-containing protein [Rahnella sikkimica]AVF38068.1 hypothetical protein BV494_24525 [Rahnella sikkimica]